MRNDIHILIPILLAILAGTTSAASAKGPFENSFTADEARDARKQGRVLGASEVMRIVQRRYPHLRTADTRLVSSDRGGAKYYVKMLSADGRVVEVTVDAQSGRILSTRGN
ncbi:MAG: hypothetical protein COA47_06405 [Robiginitomaculum sp.]|nr:MAG: hypothetical protein COA47_06405 [Robiginitomaculum sp.]